VFPFGNKLASYVTKSNIKRGKSRKFIFCIFAKMAQSLDNTCCFHLSKKGKRWKHLDNTGLFPPDKNCHKGGNRWKHIDNIELFPPWA
jgi:hypothetical protein